MKIAILSESPADEAALKILVEAILGEPVQLPQVRNRRPPGWTGVMKVLPAVLSSLYFTPDADGGYAEGLVVVLDSNGSLMHGDDHSLADADRGDCRFCEVRRIVDKQLRELTQLPDRVPLRCAIGLAVPTIEAWLFSNSQVGLTEAMWKVARNERREPYKRSKLKELLYGTSRPTLELETKIMLERMGEIVVDLSRIQTAFPGGFTPLFDEIRAWK